MLNRSRKIKILVVDDEAIVRELLDGGLSADPDLEVIARAGDAKTALAKIEKWKPDVVTLDVEMPGRSGLELLREVMTRFPVPVIMVSSFTRHGMGITLDSLRAGAIDFVAKPSGRQGGFDSMLAELRGKIKQAAGADMNKWRRLHSSLMSKAEGPAVLPAQVAGHGIGLIAVGASTGGTTALRTFLGGLPRTVPGIAVVQHMPPEFTGLFAARLNQDFDLEVKEAEDGDEIAPGRVLIAPGDVHLTVVEEGGRYLSRLLYFEKVSSHRPSVDVLFDSVVKSGASRRAVGIIMTGMGRDGAEGLKKMRANGSHTIGQDEETSIVYGMPGVAMEYGAVVTQAPLDKIAGRLLEFLSAGRTGVSR